MAYTPLPPPPQRSEPASFADKGDAFLGALPQFGEDMEAVRLTALDAIDVAPGAIAAAQYRGDYNPATTYQIGQSVSYGADTWYAKTVNTGVTPAAGAAWLRMVGVASVTGQSGKVLRNNGSTTEWFALPPAAKPERRAFFDASGTHTIPFGVSSIRAYAFGAGGNATASLSGGGGGCAYGSIAVAAGDVVTVTVAAGVATVATDGVVRLTGSPASGATAGAASKHAAVTDGGAYSGGVGAAGGGINPGGASSGSPLGAGFGGTAKGGSGWGGIGNSGGGGGGVGGAAAASQRSGPGLSDLAVITEPILMGLTAPGLPDTNQAQGHSGMPGAGGGRSAATSGAGGAGGFGGGGAGGTDPGGPGGQGGFGGGGGGSGGAGSKGGAGGHGGGGGRATTPGAGGPAAALIYY